MQFGQVFVKKSKKKFGGRKIIATFAVPLETGGCKTTVSDGRSLTILREKKRGKEKQDRKKSL